ncbi:glycosyltransferase family 2 protein [Microbacterium sp. SORGH_AS_0888]|uniref:glycosyltransferase n=1 Tax=Microbacterium sp. SORGH_AS_0888 TaxID=3041791 RepID=UPI0027864700|nr:glycosyltransferase [Microbacterium sp. SORGH_AS_0888]MDQ1130311.1 glycosyltransferase involved in cell wall biosynthesis [Microbacterium sp. SORGH_AS_0888]
MIGALAVIVPVHDEEELLGECLAALEVASAEARMRHPAVRTQTWVVLDACSDASARIAEDAGVHVRHLDARSVGAARGAGVAASLAGLAGLDPAEIWTAHTDGDSVVPPNWLCHQLALAASGADVFVGTVRPDFRDLDVHRIEAWWRRYTPGRANGHVHGASLGLRASVLLRAGGFAPLEEHEDVEVVAAARRLGARVVASDDAPVRTSGRQVGRTPGGYARYLREDLAGS